MSAGGEAVPPGPELTGKQRRYLRGCGHELRPSVYVGKEGISDRVLRSIEDAYRNNELIKVKVERGCPLDRKEAGSALARATASHLVQVLGRSILLYRHDAKSTSPLQLPI